jgi:hypothetical protein
LEDKIVERWSYQELEDALIGQLIGDYLKDVKSKHGVFLLGRIHKKSWRAPSGKRLDLSAVCARLQNVASASVRKFRDIDEVRVISIDFLPPDGRATQKRTPQRTKASRRRRRGQGRSP